MQGDYILAANILGAAIALTGSLIAWRRNRGHTKRMLLRLVPLILGFGLTVFGAISAYLNGLESARQIETLARTGLISPSLRIHADGSARYVSIGNTLFCIDDGDSLGFTEDGVPLLALANVGGNVVVSALVRDERREILAQVKDNHWRHNPGVLWRYIVDDGIYEIADATGRVVLQIVHFGDAVSVQAVLGLKRGEYLAFADSAASNPGTTADYAYLRSWPFGTSDKAIIRPLLIEGANAADSRRMLTNMRARIVDGIMERMCFTMGMIDVSPGRVSSRIRGPSVPADSNVVGLAFEARPELPAGQPALSMALSISPSSSAIRAWKAANHDGEFLPSLSPNTAADVIASAAWTVELSCESTLFAKNVYCVVFDQSTGLYYLPKYSITTVAPGRPGIFLIGGAGKSREFFFERLSLAYPGLSSSMLSVSTGPHSGYVLVMYSTPDKRWFALKREFLRYDGHFQIGLPVIFGQKMADLSGDVSKPVPPAR